jgi:uncharacterized protein YciI
MRFVALFHRGPRWQADKSLYRQGPPIEAHLASMRNCFDAGSLLLGGPFEDTSGGIAVLDVVDHSAAKALVDADPAVMAGVLTYELKPVTAYFDAYSGVRTTTSVETMADAHSRPS